MNQREMALLEIFLNHSQQGYLSSRFLAEEMGLSDRTVRKVIGDVSQSQDQLGLRIHSLPSKGYRLEIVDSDLFRSTYETIRADRISHKQRGNLEWQRDREHYLLHQLFFEGERIPAQDLTSLLHISPSALSKLLASIRERLAPYSLSLSRNEEGNLAVEGFERDKRHFIVDYFLSRQVNQPLLGYLEEIPLFENIDSRKLYTAILEVSREEDLSLSDYSLTNLLVHLALAIERLSSGHTVRPLPLGQEEAYLKAREISLKMMERIHLYLGIDLPQAEADYMALHLLGKGNASLPSDFQTISDNDLMIVLEDLSERLPQGLVADDLLLEGLRDHLSPLLLRLQNGIRLDNPLYQELKDSYGSLIAATKEAFSKLACLAPYQVSNPEWAYISLHILAALERQKSKESLRVLLVCGTGIGSAQVLQHRLMSHFGQRLDILACVSFHELFRQDLSQVDLILSAIDLTGQVFPKPVISISVLLPQADIQKIEAYLAAEHSSGQGQVHPLSELEEACRHCFSEDRFFCQEEAVSREDLLKEMIGRLTDSSKEGFVEDFYQQILKREELGSLIFAEGIAFPHPAKSLSMQEEIVVAICSKPLAWTEDGQDVSVVILLSPSLWENKHMKLLTQHLARLLDSITFRERLLLEPTLDTLTQLICTKEV